MKKVITVILVAVLGFVMLTGCGGNSGNNAFDPSELQSLIDGQAGTIKELEDKIKALEEGEGFDPSELQELIDGQTDVIKELEDKIKALEEGEGFDPSELQRQIDALQAEVDRLYGQYDWDNPIIITDLAAFESLYKNNRAQFDKMYLGRVVQATGIVQAQFNIFANRRNSPGVTLDAYDIYWVFFYGARPDREQEVTITGVYNSIEDSALILDACRLIVI